MVVMTKEKKEIDERIELDDPKKKSRFGLYFFLFIFLCLAGLLAYKYITYNPIMSLIDSISTDSIKNKTDGPVKLTGNFVVESNSKEYNMFNKYSIDFADTYDSNNKRELLNINVNEADASLIDFVFYKENKNFYIESSKLYDGIIKIDNRRIVETMDFSDLDTGEKITSIDFFNFDITEEEEEYLLKLFKKSLKNAFKDEKFTKSNKDLDINGKKVKVSGYTYMINKDNIQRLFNNFVNTYEDEELINILKKNGVTREEYLKILNKIKDYKIDELEDNIEFTIYVKPYILTIVGFSLSEGGEEYAKYVTEDKYSNLDIDFHDEDNTTFNSETKGDKTEFEVNVGSISAIKGTVEEKEEKELDFKMDIANELTIKLNTQYKENAVMENYDVSEAIKMEDLNQEDYASMIYNLQALAVNSPLLQAVFSFFQDDSIETSTQNIYLSAYQMYANDSKKNKKSEYVYGNGSKCSTALPINLSDNIKYAIKINKKGKVTYFQITDGEKQYSYKGSNLDLDKIKYTDYKGLNVTCK